MFYWNMTIPEVLFVLVYDPVSCDNGIEKRYVLIDKDLIFSWNRYPFKNKTL